MTHLTIVLSLFPALFILNAKIFGASNRKHFCPHIHNFVDQQTAMLQRAILS